MIGTRLGPYEILEEIGKGGMATVYRAYQPSMDRDVAIKVIHLAIATDTLSRQRFEREARLIAKLEHPHLLPVYDYNGSHNPPYIVMRYLEGGTLKDIIASQGVLPLSDIAHLTRQVAAALDYAHRQGVIHRDIKPTNILIDQDGNAFLMDFGIARMTERSEGLTQTGFAVGTPSYMSPEQGMGEPNVTPQADIYSLGVMVFQMASGQLPYTAETPMAIVLRHINDAIPKASEFNKALPPAFDMLIARAMAKKPEDRYQTATELADELTAIANETDLARPNVLRKAAQENIDSLRRRREEKRASQEVTVGDLAATRGLISTQAPIPDDGATLITPTDQRAVPPSTRVSAAPPPKTETPLQTPSATPIAIPAPGGGRRITMFVLIGAVVILAVVAVALIGQLTTDGAAQQTQTAVALAAISASETDAVTPTLEPSPSAEMTTIPTESGAASIDPTDPPTETSTSVPPATQTPTETLTETPSTPIAQALRPLILRAGPGLDYARVGELVESQQVDIIGTTEDGSWFQVRLPDGEVAWLASNFVQTFGSLMPVPFVEPPTRTSTPSYTPTSTYTPSPTPTDTPSPTPTPTSTPTLTFTPSNTPTFTLTPSETPTPTPSRAFALTLREIAVRAGSGSEYQQIGTLSANAEVLIIGKTADQTWLLVVMPNGLNAWLANSPLAVRVTGNMTDLPVVQAPTITPAA
jgi:serine/threonine protein kinase/uncharacterized protein YraI